jgi:hypothetical protein
MGTLGLLLLFPSGVAGQNRGVESFQGSCDFAGTVRFDPPLGTTSRDTTVVAEAPGQCTGTLTDRRGRAQKVDKAPALYYAVSHGVQSCAENPGSTGTGVLTIRRARIDFNLSETRVGALALATLTGRAGGSMTGTGMASGDPAATAAACAGPGLSETGINISGSSSEPISG